MWIEGPRGCVRSQFAKVVIGGDSGIGGFIGIGAISFNVLL